MVVWREKGNVMPTHIQQPEANAPADLIPAPATTARTLEDLAREIAELGKQLPPPDVNAILADARWFEESWGKPALTQYRGNFVVVFNGAVVAHGIDALQLQLDSAKKLNIHPQRFIVEYIPPAGF